MAWTDSRIYRQFVSDVMTDTAQFKLGGTDAFFAALYGTGATPDKDATAANSAYAATWAGAAEIIDTTGGGTDWPTGGVTLGTETLTTPSTGVIMFDAPDTASGATADIAAAFGCNVYDTTLAAPVADQGVCFNYFGGSNSVTNGTFTIVWHANGLWRITV
jgi:hypothetical protein